MSGGQAPLRLTRVRRRLIGTAALASTLAIAGCGTANTPAGSGGSMRYRVQAHATFPSSQRLSEHTHMVITVRNVSSSTIPNIAATVCNLTCSSGGAGPGEGTSAEAFAADIGGSDVGNPSRPVWIVDRPPGPCGSSCLAGGPGSAVTAYANTWALGPLAPGQTKVFDWTVTAVSPGRHIVAWVIAAGLDSGTRAELADGSIPQGTFTVTIHSKPARSYVSDTGKIVTTP